MTTGWKTTLGFTAGLALLFLASHGMPAEEPSAELLEQISNWLTEQPGALPASADIDLTALREQYQNAMVKIEFTGIVNKEETKMNPTKSERYYAGQETPHGSGFFINESEILTNAHVVEEARRGSIRVKSPAAGNVEFKAKVVGIGGSETIDLALLRLPEDELLRFKKRSGLEKIPYLEFGDSNLVKQADPVAIFGYPQSSDELKLIQGKVTGREYLKLEMDRFVCGHQFIEVGPGGVIQPGNSGGPALNREGRVVGIPARGSGWAFEQGWLIPSNVVLHFLQRLKTSEAGGKSLELPGLGLRLTEDSPGTAVWKGAPEECVIFELGVVVLEVTPGSLADAWGIREGDLLVGFANRQKGISCALDFEGYRVVTGKMKDWPPSEVGSSGTSSSIEPAKLHLSEMILMSDVGDDITLWSVRRGRKGMQAVERKLEYREAAPLPHLGSLEKPAFELWGDFVAQDFNDYNVPLFEVPVKEILQGGVLVTFTEPNSLARRRGMKPRHRSRFGFSFSREYEPATRWVIIESVNGKPVRDLEELRVALRQAERQFEQEQQGVNYDPARRILMKERYIQIGFRTNTHEGRVLHLEPAFPIDEALECREGISLSSN